MMMQSSRKPPLPRGTPIHLRLRPRRAPLQTSSSANIMQTPPGSLEKPQMVVKSACDSVEGGESENLRPEYRTISSELTALAKMVHQEFSAGGSMDVDDVSLALNATRSPLFKRGRFYEEYSARRNERLKRKKKGEGIADDHHHHHLLSVRVESTKKRRDTITITNSSNTIKRKVSVPGTPMSGRRSIIPPPAAPVPCTPMSARRSIIPPAASAPASSSSRYLLRSSTSKENKKPPLTSSAMVGQKKSSVRRARRI